MNSFIQRYWIPVFFALFILLALSSCKEDSNPVDTNQIFASSTKTFVPENGGAIELTNKNGDQVKLIIPPNALNETTNITLEILNDVVPNPFSKNIITTVRLLPDGLKLNLEATLQIMFKTTIADTSKTMLYFKKQNDLAYPLMSTWLDNNTISGTIYHFSDYGSAEPTQQEIESQSNKIKSNFNYDVWDWQGFAQYVLAMLKYIDFALMYGDDEIAQTLKDELEQRVKDQCNLFLDQPMPNEPCGYYLTALLKYHEMFCKIVTDDPNLDERFQNRINNTLNKCDVRGELDFDYNYCVAAQGAEICRTISGSVPFTVNTTVEPYGQINGSGVLDWNGTMNGIPPNCIYTEVGTVNVTLGGEMTIDEYGILWMDFEILEHASGNVTIGCDGINNTYPFNPPDVTHEIRLLAQEGSELIMPIPGVTSGQFKWVLHINFQQ